MKTKTPCLIFEARYNQYAIELTPEVASALSEILSAKKVKHIYGSDYVLEDWKCDLGFHIGNLTEGTSENSDGNN